jgi:hypothetical protein
MHPIMSDYIYIIILKILNKDSHALNIFKTEQKFEKKEKKMYPIFYM